jgi:maltooligosyltrehalose trehalohydrolase
VWAPKRRRVVVVFDEGGDRAELASERGGYFAGLSPGARPGMLYRFELDGGSKRFADPASRFQPNGPHGPSEIVDPEAFAWTDAEWKGIGLPGQVIYEMHVGTFTRTGTWSAAAAELAELSKLGVTVVEVMPVADFPGRFGWGYDGVNWFAPTHLYGRPDDFRRFVDRAHSLGLGVILDVVYNHFGPDGNYAAEFSDGYFSRQHKTEWGTAINYDGADCHGAREFVLANAAHWIREYHLDGLRLDATQDIFDDSGAHILGEISRAVRAAAGGRSTIVVAENEPQHAKLVRPEAEGGYGIDALWNDDYHHIAMVALTGKTEAYYRDYRGSPQEFISAAKRGYLYQGQFYAWQKKARGKPALDLEPSAFVAYFQNHDQVANSGRGLRAHRLTSPGRYRALTALTLLLPSTPMLFQGQEFASSAPFVFFGDHRPDLAKQVFEGRKRFLAQFSSLALPEAQSAIDDPASLSSFEKCKLDFAERAEHAHIYRFHRDVLTLRRTDPVFRAQRRGSVDGAVLGPDAFVLRFFGGPEGDRLVIVNLGKQIDGTSIAEPLLASPADGSWRECFNSEDVKYGGAGAPPLAIDQGFGLPAECTLVLAPHR